MAVLRASQRLPFSLLLSVWSLLVLIRVLVGYQPHSGQDNYHGLHSAYGGDFEAQRHWMELTWQLPISEWYWYDLHYWGLDYPPLTAYVSWICGLLSSRLVGPQSVQLDTSRGLEDPTHKAFMRATVLFLDMLIYASAVWIITRPNHEQSNHNVRSLCSFIFAMVQPAIILIDHGHFQYNTTALGLSLWSFNYISKDGMANCVLGSILFCMALSFKQMMLYYAPVVFFYLLGRCFRQNKFSIRRFAGLAVAVLLTFLILWWPVIANGPETTTYLERLLHVLRRIFPLQRGLFEGKVSNLWCALSVKPFRLRKRIPVRWHAVLSTTTTTLLLAPSCQQLFQIGKRDRKVVDHRRYLLWGATSSSLSFFLASFQVHEKSILLALAPASLLFVDDTRFSIWFSIVAAWTLWPLMQIDRLETAYVCSIIIFVSLLRIWQNTGWNTLSYGEFDRNGLVQWFLSLTYFGMLTLHLLQAIVVVPSDMRDLFAVLWSISGCGLFCVAWGISCWQLFRTNKEKTH